MSRPDVAIAGGGPAGAALAALAASAGLRVVVIERSRFPRDKVCGEFVSAEGCRVLERLGVLAGLERRGARRMRSWRITDRRGRPLEADLPPVDHAGGEALGVSRALLDMTLLDLARGRGAEVRERWEVRAPAIEHGRARGLLARAVGGGGDERIDAPVVVGADGRRSALLRRLHPAAGDPTRTSRRSWFGLKLHLDGDPARLGGRVELHAFDRGYAGLAAIEQRRINLCLMTTVGVLRSCDGSPERLFRERVLANPAVRDAVGDLPAHGRWHSVGPLRFGARRPASHGALFIGDAAGTIDPYGGEGISNALRAAELALPVVVRAAERGMLDDDLAAEYARAWRAAFGPVTRRLRWLSPLFERPRVAGVAVALGPWLPASWVPRVAQATRTG